MPISFIIQNIHICPLFTYRLIGSRVILFQQLLGALEMKNAMFAPLFHCNHYFHVLMLSL